MKTIKIILAILLLISLLPVTGCVFGNEVCNDIETELEAVPLNSLTAEEILRLPDLTEELSNVQSSWAFLVICTFVLILSAGVIGIAWRKKFYGALTAGVLVLIPFAWNASLQKSIQLLSKDSILRRLNSFEIFENTSTLAFANFMLFLPMALFLIIGVIEVIVHFTKKNKKGAVVEAALTPEPAIAPAPSSVPQASSNLDDLKKIKELLDAGIITQEEFEAKKKQILGL